MALSNASVALVVAVGVLVAAMFLPLPGIVVDILGPLATLTILAAAVLVARRVRRAPIAKQGLAPQLSPVLLVAGILPLAILWVGLYNPHLVTRHIGTSLMLLLIIVALLLVLADSEGPFATAPRPFQWAFTLGATGGPLELLVHNATVDTAYFTPAAPLYIFGGLAVATALAAWRAGCGRNETIVGACFAFGCALLSFVVMWVGFIATDALAA